MADHVQRRRMILFIIYILALYGFVFAAIFSALTAIRSLEPRFRLRFALALCLFILIASGSVYALLAPDNISLLV